MTLHCVVCIKQVPDHEAVVRVESEQNLFIEDRYICSFYDEIAIEAALRIKKDHPDTRITAISAGGRRAVEALRRAVAMGIDEVFHVGDESIESAGSMAIARVLAAKIGPMKPDLVMCGKQAGDDDMGAVGPMLAELLGMVHANAVLSLELNPQNQSFELDRKTEGEIWRLRGSLPLLIGVEKGLAEPHVPVVTRVMKAMKAKIENEPVSKLGIGDHDIESGLQRVRYLQPPVRGEVRMLQAEFPENVEELVRCLQDNGVLS